MSSLSSFAKRGIGLQEQDRKFIVDVLSLALKKIPAEGGDAVVARIHTPDDQGVGALLQSRDQRTALVLIELTTSFFDRRNWPSIDQIEGLVAELREKKAVREGLEIAITGSATTGRDMGQAELKSAHEEVEP